tara:strand:+ start:285 stop:689 length:405 start_codon:yes stop_codon:yes gene_type:complete
MKMLETLTRSIKNVFVGSHKGDDISDEWFQKPHPHDSMPIANGSNRYASPEKIAELESYSKQVKEESNPRPEEDMADWFKVEKPDEKDEIVQDKTVHEKMYEIATAKYNPFSVGGSENIHDFDSQGGSEKIQEK